MFDSGRDQAWCNRQGNTWFRNREMPCCKPLAEISKLRRTNLTWIQLSSQSAMKYHANPTLTHWQILVSFSRFASTCIFCPFPLMNSDWISGGAGIWAVFEPKQWHLEQSRFWAATRWIQQCWVRRLNLPVIDDRVYSTLTKSCQKEEHQVYSKLAKSCQKMRAMVLFYEGISEGAPNLWLFAECGFGPPSNEGTPLCSPSVPQIVPELTCRFLSLKPVVW